MLVETEMLFCQNRAFVNNLFAWVLILQDFGVIKKRLPLLGFSLSSSWVHHRIFLFEYILDIFVDFVAFPEEFGHFLVLLQSDIDLCSRERLQLKIRSIFRVPSLVEGTQLWCVCLFHIFDSVVCIKCQSNWRLETVVSEGFVLEYAVPLRIFIGKFEGFVQIYLLGQPRLRFLHSLILRRHHRWINRLETLILDIPIFHFLVLNFILVIVGGFTINIWNHGIGVFEELCHLLGVLVSLEGLKLDLVFEHFVRALELVLI